MLSRKADLKNSELLGVLAASILCAKQGCEADGPEISIGPLTLRLYQGQARQEAKRGKKGQLSLLELAGGKGGQEAPRQKPAEKPREQKPRGEAAAESKARQAAAQESREEKEKRVEKAEARQAAAPPPRPLAVPAEEAAEAKVDLSRLVEAASDVLGVDAREARRILESVLLYLSNYPSVGLLRFFDDLKRTAKAEPDALKKVLNLLRSFGVVELHELGVVNLRKRIELKRETRL
ncbi:MAG: hypothetical protein RXR06_05830 [Thermoproteus sp.]